MIPNDKFIQEIKEQISLMLYDRNKYQVVLNEEGGGWIGKDIQAMRGEYNQNVSDPNAEVYASLNAKPYDWNIARVIKAADQINDKECWAQYAFNKIKDKEMYYNVGKYLRYDPINYLEDYLDISENACGMKGVQTIRSKWYSLGSMRYPYTFLDENPTTENIIRILKEAKGKITENDREYWAVYAIKKIKDKEQFYDITVKLNMDPIQYVREQIGITGFAVEGKENYDQILSNKTQKLGVGTYPYGILKSGPSISLIAKVLDESLGLATYDKPAWAEAAFNSIVKFGGDDAGIVYREVCKELGKDAYNYVKYYESTSERYNEGYKTIDECYAFIKSKSKGLEMYWDYSIGSEAMYRILESKTATPNYVADVLKGSRGTSSGTDTTLGSYSFKGFRLYNDCESCIVAAFMAIPNKSFYDEVKRILGKDPYEFVDGFLDDDELVENLHRGTNIKKEYDRILGSKTQIVKSDSEEQIQEAINKIKNLGFGGVTNYDDCKTANQVIYKAYIYGFHEIMKKMQQIRDSKYKTTDFKEVTAFVVPGSTSPVTIETYEGYPSCLYIDCVQLGSSSSAGQKMDEKIKITCGNFDTQSSLTQEALENLYSYLSPDDQNYITEKEKNVSTNYNLENNYIIYDFVYSFDNIINQYKYHFLISNELKDGLFPQGPDKFFKYWFDTENYSDALQRATAPAPYIFCQNDTLRSKKTLKMGMDAELERLSTIAHVALPLVSVALSIFGGLPGALIGAALEGLDAALYYKEDDPYMAGLTLLFAFVGPLDNILGTYVKLGRLPKLLNMFKEARAGKKLVVKYTEEDLAIIRHLYRNAPKLTGLAEMTMLHTQLFNIYKFALKSGPVGYINFLSKSLNFGVISAEVLSKMGIIVGGTFYTWDALAYYVFDLCNSFPFKEATQHKTYFGQPDEKGMGLIQSSDSDQSHWFITNYLLAGLAKTQRFTSPCEQKEKEPSLPKLNMIKKIVLEKVEKSFLDIISGSDKINLGSIDVGDNTIETIQKLLVYQKLNKTFTSQSVPQSQFSSIYSNILNLFDVDRKECSFLMGKIQISPKDVKSKLSTKKIIIYFDLNQNIPQDLYKINEKVKIENTTFDGSYKIENVFLKNKKITGIQITAPYTPFYKKGTYYDTTFVKRGVISPDKFSFSCLPNKKPAPTKLQTGVYDQNTQFAVMNYQVEKKITPIDGIVGIETAKKMLDDYKTNFWQILKFQAPSEAFVKSVDNSVTTELKSVLSQKENIKKQAIQETKRLENDNEKTKKFIDNMDNNKIKLNNLIKKFKEDHEVGNPQEIIYTNDNQ